MDVDLESTLSALWQYLMWGIKFIVRCTLGEKARYSKASCLREVICGLHLEFGIAYVIKNTLTLL
jgi:hypothetical protein